MLEGSGARVGMLVTRGFRDFLEVRRGFRADPFDHRPPYPPVLVPRYLRLPVGGRIDARGVEVEPLDEADLDAAIETFRAEGVESIAVCLLHSFENGAHERRCAEVLRGRGGPRSRHSGAGPRFKHSGTGPRFHHSGTGFEWVSLSHEVVPVIGEYERGSTTVVNAYIGPKVVRYLHALDERLRALGLGAGAAGAAIERTGDLGPAGGGASGEPRAVGAGGRGGRPRLPRLRHRDRRSDHDGDRAARPAT